jgi:hypothetical protein
MSLSVNTCGRSLNNYLSILIRQGDQIGRIFAHWVTVYFGQLFENYRRGSFFWATFFHDKVFELISSKNVLGHILGDFFTRASGHPDFVFLEFDTQFSKSILFWTFFLS